MTLAAFFIGLAAGIVGWHWLGKTLMPRVFAADKTTRAVIAKLPTGELRRLVQIAQQELDRRGGVIR